MIIHAEVREGGLGNCIPLEQIGIFNWSSAKDTIDIINNTNVNIYKEPNVKFEPVDYHNYLVSSNLSLSMFAKEIVIYLSGFVVHKLEKNLLFDICVSALIGNKQALLNFLISLKTKGGLSYPSDMISIRIITENVLKNFIVIKNLFINY